MAVRYSKTTLHKGNENCKPYRKPKGNLRGTSTKQQKKLRVLFDTVQVREIYRAVGDCMYDAGPALRLGHQTKETYSFPVDCFEHQRATGRVLKSYNIDTSGVPRVGIDRFAKECRLPAVARSEILLNSDSVTEREKTYLQECIRKEEDNRKLMGSPTPTAGSCSKFSVLDWFSA